MFVFHASPFLQIHKKSNKQNRVYVFIALKVSNFNIRVTYSYRYDKCLQGIFSLKVTRACTIADLKAMNEVKLLPIWFTT